MSVLKRVVDFFLGDTTQMVADFRETFPGKCPVCSFHRYGLAEGMTSETMPKPHRCPERRDNPSGRLPGKPNPADYDSPVKFVMAMREWERAVALSTFVEPLPLDQKIGG